MNTQALGFPRALAPPAPRRVESERALVRRAQQGDHDAFGQLVARYQDRIFSTLLRMTGRRDDALDLAQDAFVRAYTRLAGFRGHSTFYTWLYRIAVNRATEWLRRERRRAAVVTNGVAGLEEHAGSDDTATLVRDRALFDDLRAAVDALPAIYRAAVILHDIEGMKHTEIAAVLQCAPGTIRARLSRGRRLLRERLAEWL